MQSNCTHLGACLEIVYLKLGNEMYSNIIQTKATRDPKSLFSLKALRYHTRPQTSLA